MLKTYPFYIKSTVILLGLVLFCFILSILRGILVPISFALMLAILLNPFYNFLHSHKIGRVWAILISLLVAMFLISAIVFFLSSQIAHFGAELPILKKKFLQLFYKLQHYMQSNFGMPIDKQDQLIEEAKTSSKPMVESALGTVMGSMTIIFLLPVYTFLFLFYKTLVLNFLFEVFDEKNSNEVGLVLAKTKSAIQSYMVGLLLEGLVVAILNIGALLALGVEYAVLIGVLGAILNVLPYIGGVIAILLPVVIASITRDGFHTQLLIIAAYTIIQFIDNHFLIPYIVSSKVKINALISVVIVLLGGELWGVSGMFLSIPFIGILKIVFDRVEDMRSWGKLLGDEIPTRHKGEIWNRFRRKQITVSEQITDNIESHNP